MRDAELEVLHEWYDYDLDSMETKNIASDNPEVVAEMEPILERYPEAKK